MRKQTKTKINSLLEQLKEAHEKIGQCMAAGRTEDSLHLLEDCQQAAIAVGSAAEETEGTDEPLIPLLEDYCEFIYQLSESLFSGDVISVHGMDKKLVQFWQNISNRVNYHITTRKEIVFLPYKASMWDSLESVWRAANEDEDCDAYVVPIPYYDKNPDGTVKEWHYEIDQYPKDIPVMDYRDYDLNRRPDMIFIHNPYDEYNLVTSVHPLFYSGELKKYTDRLVYIPYFVLAEIEPTDRIALENASSFVRVKGVINADIVVVQSEKMRQCYIESMVQLQGEQTRSLWEKKILGLGSPKFDQAAAAKGADIELPDAWKAHIHREDGKRKKVIFYNTSVTALLKHREGMLKKMQRVFASFRELRDEVTLLWRPHPLIPATIESMCPQLQQDYRRLVEDYCTENYGIYDDSPLLERAIMVSDAYYGDPSSVVQLCQSAGMPVMIQNVEV